MMKERLEIFKITSLTNKMAPFLKILNNNGKKHSKLFILVLLTKYLKTALSQVTKKPRDGLMKSISKPNKIFWDSISTTYLLKTYGSLLSYIRMLD